MKKRQSYVLSPPVADGGGKTKGKRLTMEDLDDDDVADEHFRPPKHGESSSSEEENELDEEETPPKRNKVFQDQEGLLPCTS